jgi:alkanesulfonate monooxygenase SsuD/methylene tetrahydromethanopterin reductase-like flavin-dependent oxidoreductase (luciferase family)
MLRYSAVGTPDVVRDAVTDFAKDADADELMVVHMAPTITARLRSLELLADGYELSG